MENELYSRNLIALLEALTHYNVIFQTTNMFYDDVFYKLSESFNVFVQEIISQEYRGKPLEFYLELPWENELDISKYLLDVEQF